MIRRRLVAIGLAIAGCGTPYGIYHTVEPGQTLYRIAKNYNLPLQDLAEINNIADPDTLHVGQRIFVPGAEYQKKVDPIARTMDAGPAKAPRPTPKPGGAKPAGEFDPGKTVKVSKGRLAWPVQGQLISGFGIRNGEAHDGIDIKAPEGVQIGAAEDGKVIYSGELSGYGNVVIVKHEGYLATVYAHNRKNLVGVGDLIEKGDPLAELGDTGRASTPHLHFEVRERSKPRNPLFYLP